MKYSGIYKIQSKVKPQRVYIGSSLNIYKRWSSHLSFLKNNGHPNKKLQNHYNKYGKNDFMFSIIICCDKEDLISTEQFYIDSYNPWFNCHQIAKANFGMISYMKGKHHTDEAKRKISKANKGNKHTEEWKEKQSEFMKGKKYALGQIPSKEKRQRMSIIMMGNKYSAGKKNALGHTTSKEWRENHSKLMKGKRLTLEHIQNIINAKMGKSTKLRGKPWSEKRRKAQELKKVAL